MELRQLKHFVTIAETLNYHRAAERLNIAQPPLSVSIRKLEDEFGARLFNRKRKVVLTEAGHAALEEARKALHHASEAARIAKAVAAGEAGRIRLAFAGSATYRLLPELIPRFGARFPNVVLTMREGTNTDIMAMFEEHAIDLGLVRVPTELPDSIELVTIERDTLVAVLPKTSPLATRRKVTMRDLAAYPFVDHAASGHIPGMNAATRRVFEESGIRPRFSQMAKEVHTVISLVASGLGVALVPSVAAQYSSDKIAFRPVADLPPSGRVGIALAYRPTEETPAARRFREVAVETIGRGRPARGT